jgi:DeoR/GlpR family transcriptional regulator of sugar metabolism
MKPERQSLIRRLLEENGKVTVPDLRARLGVSEATIRRDLEELDSLGWIRRAHGGAVRLERANREPPMLQRVPEQWEEKRAIGAASARMVRDGDTIFLGSGTTVLEVARALPAELRLAVITNSLPIVHELLRRPKVELIIIGGMLRLSELSMVGHIAEQAVREFRADRVFMGMRAIDVRHGLTSDFLPEAITDRTIMTIAPEVVVVADHTKFGRVSSVVVAPVSAADVIVTDSKIQPEILAELQELNLDVRTA